VRPSIYVLLSLNLVFAAAAAYSQVTPGKTSAASTTDAHPVLIELFTSEGCSSCPPADLLVQKLDTYQPVPGAQLIVLSEHVDYWDHDGWKDPNSSALLTERQASYEHVLGHDTSFTPQLIVDGTSEPQLDSPQQVQEALLKAKAAPKVSVRIAEVAVDPADPALLRTRVETGANLNKHNADVYLAVALDRVESQVLRGENGGRHLTHVAVVQELRKIGKLPKGKSFAEEVEVKLKPGTETGNLRIIAFVQESGLGTVLGAAMRKPAN